MSILYPSVLALLAFLIVHGFVTNSVVLFLLQADDEQSDWPGPEPGMSVMQLTDEEIDHEVSFSQVVFSYS